MFNQSVKEINAEFLAEEKSLDSIQRIVRESCMQGGFSRKDTNAILLAIEEGATNIIRHAYLYEKGNIRIKTVIFKKKIVFSLIDSGRSFNPEGTSTLNLERLVETGRKGGLGFYMIKKIMDSVEYISVSGYNELRLIKNIKTFNTPGTSFLRRMSSLRVKFSFWTTIVMAVIIGSSIYYMDIKSTDQIKEQLDDTVKALAKTIADQSAGFIINQRSDVEFDQLNLSNLRANPELRQIVLLDENQNVLANSANVASIKKQFDLPSAINPKITNISQNIKWKDEDLYYLIMPIKSGNRNLGYVHIMYDDDIISSKLNQSQKEILLITILLSIVGIIAIYLLSDYFVKPIAKITHKVKRFTSGELETELPLEGAEEFFEISRAFNQMMTRLNRDQKNIISREKLAKEIEVASQIQKTLLPGELPDIPNLMVDAFYKSASMVGGDLYDIFKISPDKYCLTVADVSGKGVPASMVMSMLRTVIRIFADGDKSAKKTLVEVNGYLEQNIPQGMFVTIMMVIYNCKKNSINLVSAGHNPLLFYKEETKEVLKINPTGMPLGIPVTIDSTFEDKLEEITLPLRKGDLFFLFTDGLTEAKNKKDEEYGMDNLFKFVGEQASGKPYKSVAELTNNISLELDSFSGYMNPADDITFIIARYLRDE
ncbi:MAG: SpoIIE family protein phosphatase, partial [candidate division Zixibacteria bacterium]|nr:SpoIIE family protein phosphatase [candidate division Zixibacteria bacterium]